MLHFTSVASHRTMRALGAVLLSLAWLTPDSSLAADQDMAAQTTEFKLPDGLQWETNLDDPVVASTEARSGGTYYDSLFSFPVTFRSVGPNSNSGFRSYMDHNRLGLLDSHPTTYKFIPSLATHWAVAKDNQTVYYKLNLNAQWSDGTPITAQDYAYTIEFMRSPHILAPWYNNYYTEELKEVVVHAPDVISVVSSKPHIKKVLLRTTSISPMHRTFNKLDKDWVKNYNWKVEPLSGPYYIASWKHGHYVTLKKIKDWWGQNLKYYKGKYNFETIHLKVIRDPESVWQHFITGKLMAHGLTIASYYHEKATGELFDKGYIKKLWHYNQQTHSSNILWINKTKAPWNDVNVRKAFAHALNFDKVNKEILRGEYLRLPAFYYGFGGYDNPGVKAREFSIDQAAALMKQSGWSLGKDTFWQKNGTKLTAKILTIIPHHQDRLILLKEEAKKAGFDLDIQLQDGAAGYKSVMQKDYAVLWAAWGGGRPGVFPPRYREYFHSEFAAPQSNNFTMSASGELDTLIAEYRGTFDEAKKQQLSQAILQYIHDDAAFIPGFINPFVRIGYWRYLQLPKLSGFKSGVSRETLMYYGWIDPAAEKQLKEYQKAGKSFGKSETIDETFRIDQPKAAAADNPKM